MQQESFEPLRHKIQFPPEKAENLKQDEAFFYLVEHGERRRIRLHDYDKIFEVPGLYEQVVYDRLKCKSPTKVFSVLESAVTQNREAVSELRVLDLGAGNGMMGKEISKTGVARSVGIDIISEAKLATERDHPGVYDAYYVCDLRDLAPEAERELESWSLNCLTTVAALGFGDIPPAAFMRALNLISETGWVAFNIKESFLDRSDQTGFSKLIRELIFSEYLDLYHLERYRHRYSLQGRPLYYFALAGRKNCDVAEDFLDSLGLGQ